MLHSLHHAFIFFIFFSPNEKKTSTAQTTKELQSSSRRLSRWNHFGTLNYQLLRFRLLLATRLFRGVAAATQLGLLQVLAVGEKKHGRPDVGGYIGGSRLEPKKSLGVKTPVFVKVDRFATKENGSMYTMEIGRIDRENGGFGKWRSPFQIWLFWGVYVKFRGCIKFNVRNIIEIVSFTNQVLYRLFEVVKQPFQKVPIIGM